MTDRDAYKSMTAAQYASWRAAGGNRAKPAPSMSVVPYKPPTLVVVGGEKAVSGPGATSMATRPHLSDLLTADPTTRMAAYLRAYSVGWFYKAERKISRDISGLGVALMPEDGEGDNQEALVRPDLDIPFAALDPAGQFLRLMERPNPYYTGRTLRRKTMIRRDMAGAAFWWLEGGAGGALPTGIYGISPSRMWPAYDRQGRRIGWVMDRDKPGGGVPFDNDEIVAFVDDGPDDAYNPVGVVQAVWAQVPLTERLAQHTADMLATGGRLAGMLWPKERSLSEDEFVDAQRAWRNVASDPNAARRLLIFPEPMEYATGAANPKDIGIPELAALTRDEILTAFPISPYMLGAPMGGGGLDNGGAARREEKATYWEETIHPRVEDFEEDVQVQLVTRYEAAMGATFDFEIQEPNLDDSASLLEKAAAFRALIAIGFDPEATVEHVGLDDLQWNGLPDMLDPAKQLEMQQAAAEASEPAEQDSGSRVVVRDADPRDTTAVQQTLVGKTAKAVLREEVLGLASVEYRSALRDFLLDQRDRIVERIRATLPTSKAARLAMKADDWWDPAEDDRLLASVERPRRAVVRSALQKVSDDLDRFILPDRIERVTARNLAAAGERIVGINEATRKAVADTLAEGIRRGYSITQLIDGVPSENFPGVKDAPLGNGQPAFDELRAETIARTESMNVWNDAAVRGYGELGARSVQAIDGDKDAECANRDGRTYSIEDALGVTDHPNGTLDWVPVVDKSWHPAEATPQPLVVSPVVHLHMADVKLANQLPAPIVNVTNDLPAPVVVNEVAVPAVTVQNDVKTPDVRVVNEVVSPEVKVSVEAPSVTVHAPEPAVVNVTNEVVTPEVKVTNEVPAPVVHVTNEVITPEVHVAPAEVTVTVPEPRPVTKRVERDESGRVTRVVEE